MQRVVSGVLLALSVLGSGCLQRSEVELTVFVRESVLDAVDPFPVRVITKTTEAYNEQIDICEWENGFLELELAFTNFKRCPETMTIEAIVTPLDAPCVDGGVLQQTQDWPEERYGHGSIRVFGDESCNVLEQRTLTVSLPDEE